MRKMHGAWFVLSAALAAMLPAGCNDAAPAPAPDDAATGEPLQQAGVDLSDPAKNLEAFVKVRGSLDPQREVVFYWKGTIYSFVKEEGLPVKKSNQALFTFEGFNVARFVKVADGYQMLSREASFYEDPSTGEILDCWANPLNGLSVPVVHVWNDPVNFAFTASGWRVVPFESFGPKLVMRSDILLAYPSPLPVSQYPAYSAGDLYQAAELFNFYTLRPFVELPFVREAPADISWTRFGQYLPWMQMGQEPGNLIYQTAGTKLARGWDDLPAKVRDYVLANHPEFRHAPEAWPPGQPSETSWTYFKRLNESGEYSPTCP